MGIETWNWEIIEVPEDTCVCGCKVSQNNYNRLETGKTKHIRRIRSKVFWTKFIITPIKQHNSDSKNTITQVLVPVKTSFIPQLSDSKNTIIL